MPYKRSSYAVQRRKATRRMRGAGFGQWLSKAFNWLKGNKILSSIGKVLTPLAPGIAGPITAGLSAVGLGRRRARRVGGALNLAGMKRRYGVGGGLVPAGGRRRRVHLLM